MRSFRPLTPDAAPERALDLLVVGQLIDAAMQPDHFYADPQLHLTWIAGRSETIAWEIFRGRLLDASQTRLRKTFLSWHVFQNDETNPAPEPMISVKLDVQERQIHVTRGLLSYGWEGYDAGGGVIESRETIRWTRELVSTILLEQFADLANLRDELICVLWQAVVGTSRLPLTSVEAPLPAFVLGQLYYHYRADYSDSPIDSWEALLPLAFGPEVAGQETVKLVEFILRLLQPEQLPRFADLLMGVRPHRWAVGEIGNFWRRMFNDVSLSPYTQFVENALACIDLLAQREDIEVGERINFLGRLLRQLGRHLTAYDLVTFHHRGANYPDALLLDAVLKRYLQALELFPDRFLGDDPKARRRRRALRQGCLMRRHYEGLLVPDLPTSPGENARVMPATHPRVSDEQLLQIQHRRRRLFADDPLPGLLTKLARLVLARSVSDLENLDERAELGLGLFIDRPLGYAKAPAEPDQTPLLAHEAFSSSIAKGRWQELARLCEELNVPVDRALEILCEQGPWPAGVPHAALAEYPRLTASLCDVRKVADDFVIVRTKLVGLVRLLIPFKIIQALRQRYRLQFLQEVCLLRLCVQAFDEANQPALVLYDGQLRRRVEIRIDVSQGYAIRAGVELPKAGLRVVAVWEDTDDPELLKRRATDEVFKSG